MSCPKCKAKIGVMKHEIILDSCVAQGTRCVICGYWSQPNLPYKRKTVTRRNETAM